MENLKQPWVYLLWNGWFSLVAVDKYYKKIAGAYAKSHGHRQTYLYNIHGNAETHTKFNIYHSYNK